jgi:hypothetical protein
MVKIHLPDGTEFEADANLRGTSSGPPKAARPWKKRAAF